MKIALTGASGFLGTMVTGLLSVRNHECLILGRRKPAVLLAGASFEPWDALRDELAAAKLDGVNAIIHLAGEPVAQRWTAEAKARIRDSRVLGTASLVRAVEKMRVKPELLVAASAVGYYGSRGDEVLTEESAPGTGFLPETCVAWEREIDRAKHWIPRVVKLRIGIVLGAGGGALDMMLPPFRLGVGGRIGDGRMWMPWIHLDDIVALIEFALTNREVDGAMNAVAPSPARNAEFTKALGRVLRRPTIFPAPPIALKLLYGEMSEMVLGSTRAEPAAALRAGYSFRHRDLEAALRVSIP